MSTDPRLEAVAGVLWQRDYPDYTPDRAWAAEVLTAADKADAAAGVLRLPGIVSTEWGVHGEWGPRAVESEKQARNVVRNMTGAGHDARVVWRGVTEWQTP